MPHHSHFRRFRGAHPGVLTTIGVAASLCAPGSSTHSPSTMAHAGTAVTDTSSAPCASPTNDSYGSGVSAQSLLKTWGVS